MKNKTGLGRSGTALEWLHISAIHSRKLIKIVMELEDFSQGLIKLDKQFV